MKWLALVLLVACGDSSSGAIPDSGPCVADPTPPGGTCPPACASCDAGVCHIDCASGACNDTTVKCPADFACEVACNGLDSCDTSTIECPSAYACSVTCTAYDACGDVTLKCGKGTCTMTCNGPTESCGGSTMDCGTGGDCKAECSGVTGPALDCAGACGCTPC
jgi:hypothetical protein